MENTGRYQIDSFGNQIYPLSSDGGERYIKNGKFDIMAKKRDFRGNIHPYFAHDKDGNPICPFLKENMKYLELNIPYPKRGDKELYPKLDNREYYIGQDENCKYARDENNQEYYARFMNEFYYAFKRNEKGDLVDFPIENQQKKEAMYILFVDKIQYPLNWPERRIIYPAHSNDFVDRILYPLNWTKRRVIYPVDSSGNEYYLKNRGKQYYGHLQFNITALGVPIYAKNKLGNDILAFDKTIPYYAFSIFNFTKQSESYPEMKNRRQFYLRQNNREIYAKHKKQEIYAKTENRDEYCALDKKNISYYAIDENNIEIYPSTRLGKNIYRMESNKEKVAENKNSKQGFYAKDQFLNEFYPKQF